MNSLQVENVFECLYVCLFATKKRINILARTKKTHNNHSSFLEMMLWLKDCGCFAKWRNYNDNYGICCFTCVRTNQAEWWCWLGYIPPKLEHRHSVYLYSFRWGGFSDLQRNVKCSKLWNQRIIASGYTDGLILKATIMNFKRCTGTYENGMCCNWLWWGFWCTHKHSSPPHIHNDSLKYTKLCVQCACFWVAEFVCSKEKKKRRMNVDAWSKIIAF